MSKDREYLGDCRRELRAYADAMAKKHKKVCCIQVHCDDGSFYQYFVANFYCGREVGFKASLSIPYVEKGV